MDESCETGEPMSKRQRQVLQRKLLIVDSVKLLPEQAQIIIAEFADFTDANKQIRRAAEERAKNKLIYIERKYHLGPEWKARLLTESTQRILQTQVPPGIVALPTHRLLLNTAMKHPIRQYRRHDLVQHQTLLPDGRIALFERQNNVIHFFDIYTGSLNPQQDISLRPPEPRDVEMSKDVEGLAYARESVTGQEVLVVKYEAWVHVYGLGGCRTGYIRTIRHDVKMLEDRESRVFTVSDRGIIFFISHSGDKSTILIEAFNVVTGDHLHQKALSVSNPDMYPHFLVGFSRNKLVIARASDEPAGTVDNHGYGIYVLEQETLELESFFPCFAEKDREGSGLQSQYLDARLVTGPELHWITCYNYDNTEGPLQAVRLKDNLEGIDICHDAGPRDDWREVFHATRSRIFSYRSRSSAERDDMFMIQEYDIESGTTIRTLVSGLRNRFYKLVSASATEDVLVCLMEPIRRGPGGSIIQVYLL